MSTEAERVIAAEIVVPAPVEPVWDAWATGAGAQTCFAPRCRIEARPGGAHEILFPLDAPPGQRGSVPPRLRHRFEHGPAVWAAPSRFA